MVALLGTMSKMALTIPLHLMQTVKWLVIWDQPDKPLKTQNIHLSLGFSFQLKAIENIFVSMQRCL